MHTITQSPKKKHDKDIELLLEYFRKEVQKGTGLTIDQLKSLADHQLFYISLKYLTVTKKTVCEAFDLKIEAMCREKRKLEKAGLLSEVFAGLCPVTGFRAAYLSTNQSLIKSIKQ